ncbi:hypothetical protein Glove_21g400 [Diversispora epigaea]|uniref:Uncharacterized protein n=1 Tax=Diversispora epigaea TaxID=1348612 RepID=A0A397JNE0_9GLOM|nr:hypothetical protein Glove_21g400 [Diversispora epigaea]
MSSKKDSLESGLKDTANLITENVELKDRVTKFEQGIEEIKKDARAQLNIGSITLAGIKDVKKLEDIVNRNRQKRSQWDFPSV